MPILATVADAVVDGLSPTPEPASLPPAEPETSQSDTTAYPTIKFFVKDHLGNVRVAYKTKINDTTCLVDRKVVAVMDYSPYGGLLRAWFDGDPEKWQSTGHERDLESGWDFRGARLYDASYGRFLSRDPLAGMYPAWSPYNYVLGNPVSLTDPSGMSAEGGDDWQGSAEKLATRTGGELHKFKGKDGNNVRWAVSYYDRSTGYNMCAIFREGKAHNEIFQKGNIGFHPRDNMGFVERIGYDLEQWFGPANEFGPPDDAVMTKVGKEIGAVAYHVLPISVVTGLIIGSEGPETQTWVGTGIVYASFIVTPGGGANAAAKTGAKVATQAVGMVTAKTAGNYVVYHGLDAAGVVRYVGITRRTPLVRFLEHKAAKGTGRELLDYDVITSLTGLSRTSARIAEQKLINQHGLPNLLNKINSIAEKYWSIHGI